MGKMIRCADTTARSTLSSCVNRIVTLADATGEQARGKGEAQSREEREREREDERGRS